MAAIMRTVRCPGEGAGYEISVGAGLLGSLGERLRSAGQHARVAVVTDDNVRAAWSDPVLASLRSAGLDAALFSVAPGEDSKRPEVALGLWGKLAAAGIDRDGAVIALGGGVVGDLAGFVAATYLRGLPLWQVPTSLLAMADSSVGGKVGIDLPQGKNLVGAFKQPAGVVMDLACLQTLPARELRAGLAEILKAALLAGGEAYARVRRLGPAELAEAALARTDSALAQVLLDAIDLKARIVAEDPHERGVRALLNLGHTFGHGLESWSGYALRHGEAVALGLLCAARLSVALGFADGALPGEVAQALAQLGLPETLSAYGLRADVAAIWRAMAHDKKRRAGRLRFVLLRGPGAALLHDGGEAGAAVLQALAQDALRSVA